MAGMCAARALADRCSKVVVLDRDTWPVSIDHRVGVPQSHHAHALLARGQRELGKLFPGIERALVDGGAEYHDFTDRFAIHRMWGPAPRAECGIRTLWASRPLVESQVRARLCQHPNVELRERTTVERLRFDGRRVVGVTTKDGADLDADLVVDAGGRGSKATKWLAAEGIEPPREEVVEAFVGYASRFYRRPPLEATPSDWWFDGIWIEGKPPDLPRGGVAFPVEERRWLVTAVGFARDYPPTDEKGWLEFIARLDSPLLSRVLEKCEPLGDIVGNRSTTNRFRHFERWNESVPGFIAIGDGVCAFNPAYGQGMSVAAACAGILKDLVSELGPSSPRLPKRFFAEQGRFLGAVWGLAAGADFMWPTTEGHRPFGSKLLQPYMEMMIESVHHDPAVLRAMIPIFQLVEHPAGALTPKRVRAVLQSTLRRRLRERLTGTRRETQHRSA